MNLYNRTENSPNSNIQTRRSWVKNIGLCTYIKDLSKSHDALNICKYLKTNWHEINNDIIYDRVV